MHEINDSMSIVEAYEHNGAFFCECQGTGILNIEDHYAYDDAVDGAREEGRRHFSYPSPPEIRCEEDHTCTVCGVDVINRGFELHFKVKGKPALQYHMYYCGITCIIEDLDEIAANWVTSNAKYTMRNKQDLAYGRRTHNADF